jgi:MSHA biogenesis protein MshE
MTDKSSAENMLYSTMRFLAKKVTRQKKVRFREFLVRAGVITDEQLEQAVERQQKTGQKIGDALVDLGVMSPRKMHRCLAKHLHVDFVDLGNADLREDTILLLKEANARRHRAIVLQSDNEGLLVGMADPGDIHAYDELCRLLKKPVRVALVNEADLLTTIDSSYRRKEEIDALAAEVTRDLGDGEIDIAELSAGADSADAPIIKLIQSMFTDAVQVNASDIHIEPEESKLRIRQRVDGLLQEHVIDGQSVSSALVTRLKLMSGLDISEKRLPQDGRFSIRVNEQTLDIRVSTLPTQFGESVVMRLLDNSSNLKSLDELGMIPDIRKRFEAMITQPAGMVLVTGPTGSGKTTTLYSALNQVNHPQTKIITVEDPVEYRMERINQVQVNPVIGLDFTRVLRTCLRQDPDVILVGEMRDQETVDIGLRAAMTGHLVFSTLHTVNAVATVSRLLEMGAPGYLLAAALNGIIAQRLIRRVCDNCKVSVELTPGEQAWLSGQQVAGHGKAGQFTRGAGCNHCLQTGYRGRLGVYELLEMDARLTGAMQREDLDEFNQAAANKKSYIPLGRRALGYAITGLTTLEEVIRIAGSLEEEQQPTVSASSAGGVEAALQTST